MARQVRVEYPGAIYHVTVRSNGSANLFDDDWDRKYFLGRMEEAVKAHQVRVYLFCLMRNHFHLALETPKANLGRFMQSILTGYGVYYNRRHSRHGHITQGRYGAKLVKGDEYLLKLSRYVHLNPVKVPGLAEKPLEARVEYLREYPWSTYQSYIGTRPRNKLVDYEPMLSLVAGRKSEKAESYRRFVESGVGVDDEDFLGEMVRSSRSMGSEEYRQWVDECYKELVEKREQKEDVSFRRIVRKVPVDVILEAVARVAGCGEGTSENTTPGFNLARRGGFVALQVRRHDAEGSGDDSGSAVRVRRKRSSEEAREKVAGDGEMRGAIARLDRKLAAKQR